MPVVISGNMRIEDSDSFKLLRTVHGKLSAKLAESVANSIDADADYIVVYIGTKIFLVTDNGHGMIGTYTEKDAQIIAQMSPQDRGDLRDRISTASQKSLQWLAERVGKSSKRSSQTIGKFGIGGTLSGFSVANRVTYTSRPDLSNPVFQEVASKWRGNPPSWTLNLPTRAEMDAGVIGYTLSENSPQALKDAFGITMEVGTRFALTEIDAEVLKKVRPAEIVAHLQDEYGALIRDTGLVIEVIDHITTKGMKERRGISYRVPPLIYSGIRLVEETRHAGKSAAHPFKIQLYLAAKGQRTGGVALYHRRRKVGEITSIRELQHTPWSSADLTGAIELPNELEFTLEKDVPLEHDPLFGIWLDKVLALETQLQERLKNARKAASDTKLQALEKSFTQAATSAMRRLPVFDDVLPSANPFDQTIRQREQETGREGKVPLTVSVTVMNEHNRGVEGAIIRLTSSRGDYAERVTRGSGTASFGSQPLGVYTIQLMKLANTNHKLTGKNVYEATLTEERPGFNAVFRVKTGQPAPEDKKLPNLSIIFIGWDDPNQFWDTEMLETASVLKINTRGTYLRQAIEDDDTSRMNNLVANYIANAIAGNTLAGNANWVGMQASLLFVEILSLLN